MNTLFTLLLAPFLALTTIFSPLPAPAPAPAPVQTLPASVRLDISHLQETVSNVDVRLTYLENHQVAPLGATFTVPTSVALFESSLATKISASAISMTMVSGTDKTGTALASSTYGFIIDEGSANEEMVLADCTSTVCTNLNRGLSPITGSSTVAALQHEHRRGASVKITDGPQLLILTRIINGIGSFPNLLTYKSGTACSASSANGTICDKAYTDSVAVAGASNANETTKGIIELATAVEQASSTILGSTAASLVNQTKNSTSSPLSSCNSTSVIGALCSIIAGNDGKMSPNFFATSSTSLYDFGAPIHFTGAINASSTQNFFASSTIFNINVGTIIATSSIKINGFPVSTTSPSFSAYEVSGSGLNVTTGTATSTYIAVPANIMNASSTIELNAMVNVTATGGGATSCQVSVRNAFGTPFVTSTAGAVTTSNNSYGALKVVILNNNAPSLQQSISYGIMDGTGGPVNLSADGTSSFNLANAFSIAVNIKGDSNTSSCTFTRVSVIIRP